MTRFQIGLFVSWFVLGSVAEAASAATVAWCPSNPGCLCIDWDTPGGSHIEIRCPASSVWKVGSTIIGGTFSGRGAADTSLPPSTLTPIQRISVEEASILAKNLLSGLSGNHQCIALFNGSPLLNNSWVTHPLLLIGDYVVWANGEGVRDSQGRRPCSWADAWTTCCGHTRTVFICDSFTQRSLTGRAHAMIHEALHVAGQLEDSSNNSAGPGDPPSPDHIDDAVARACQ